MNEMPWLLECRQVGKTYHTGEEDLTVLNELDFALAPCEFAAITGESGCGKSTLLHLLGCLDQESGGEIFYKGTSLAGLDEEKRNRIRNQEFGFVFQFHYLLPEFSAIENIILPGLIRGESESRLRQRAEELLNDLRLMGRKDAKPYRLSGGEQQRVAVARSLINQPEIVFMDEPTGNLDPRHSEEMIDMVLQQKQKHQLAIVMVTHSHEIARKADRHLTLRQGKLFPAS